MTRVSDGGGYQNLITSMQRLRGTIYLEDGAIRQEQLTPDGRHIAETDGRSWHVLLVEGANRVAGCARYTPYPSHVPFQSLGVSRCALAYSDEWRGRLHAAVAQEVAAARHERISFVEVGGWALAAELRGTAEALRMVMASYALARLLGGCIGLCTATHRHHSSAILRRIGGRPLQADGVELPPYYDATYGCQMEVLRFDSRMPNERYGAVAADIAQEMAASAVFAPAEEPLFSLSKHLLSDAFVGARQTERVHQ
jgi:hypothetical protein